MCTLVYTHRKHVPVIRGRHTVTRSYVALLSEQPSPSRSPNSTAGKFLLGTVATGKILYHDNYIGEI